MPRGHSLEGTVIVSDKVLEAWITRIFAACGVPQGEAQSAATVLVATNLRGVDTHGVARVPAYVDLLQRRAVNATPRITCEQRAGVLHFDGDRGLGQLCGLKAVEHGIQAARTQGCVAVVMRHVGHLGALGHFTRIAAEANLIALMMQNGPPIMALEGATKPAIGNNPLSFAAPRPNGTPLVFDMATSETAFGRIFAAINAGTDLPDGWALDSQGRRTRNAKAALDGMLLPTGGHKGIGIAMLVEVLAGSLTGNQPGKQGSGKMMPPEFGGFLLILNPTLIAGAEYAPHMADWISVYLASSGQMRVPGERTTQSEEERRKSGIPIPPALLADLGRVADKLGVPHLSA
ncbi:MAG: Ldh family oxidoreductase [Microvirga sp.]|jgi:LDH2 family malate/lactate/ureidoglycolate dehydrogenase